MNPHSDELEVIRKLRFGHLEEKEILAIFHEFQDSRRVLLNLVQHPRFPAHHALNIISRLYLADLVQVIRNPRTNPFMRKRAELDFKMRFQRSPLGEKTSLIRLAPYSLLTLFVDENNRSVLETIFASPHCTEDLILRFINRPQERSRVYEALDSTQWHANPSVAQAIALDPAAPIKSLLKIIPFAGLATLQQVVADENCHRIVRQHILQYLQNRPVAEED